MPDAMQSPDDSTALRGAMGAFATGVTIVTAIDPERDVPVGFTANSFTSVSLDPPLLLVCLAHTSAGYRIFCETESFTVNVLEAGQESVARIFATRGADKFRAVNWRPGSHGDPLIEGSLARFECRLEQRVKAGDHDILMGRVTGFSRHDGRALVYQGGTFSKL